MARRDTARSGSRRHAQSTPYADTSRGRRPGSTGAAPPAIAEPLVRRMAGLIRQRGLTVATGQFGAHKAVELVNDGPVTIVLTDESGARSQESGASDGASRS